MYFSFLKVDASKVAPDTRNNIICITHFIIIYTSKSLTEVITNNKKNQEQ